MSLEAAAKATQKKYSRFGNLGKPGYVYTNATGGRVLKELGYLRRQAEASHKMFEELKTEFEKERIRNHEWQITMQPVRKTAVAIRRSFWEYSLRKSGKGSRAGKPAILLGNEAAHEGDILTDSILLQRGDLADEATFVSLYGIGAGSLQRYQGMYSATSELLLFAKNHRFTHYYSNAE